MNGNFIPAVDPPTTVTVPAWWFAFRGGRLLVEHEGETGRVLLVDDLSALGLAPVRTQYLGTLDGRDCFSVELPGETEPPEGMSFEGLRGLYTRMDEDLYALAGRAIQIVEWDRTHQFCGACGTPTVHVPGERAHTCPNCGLPNFPRVSPAVIVLITRGDEMLLARAARFPDPFYSTLAGFVEPGETLEETLVREVREEVGIEIKNIRYFGSQPWPYPHSLMVGFTAEYAGGEIQVDGKEIVDAAWFTPDNLPRIPPKLSIARRLIDSFVDSREGP